MQARLKVIQNNANLKQVKLLPVTVIGRSADCHLKIASTEVSRKHCRLTVTDHEVLVEDLNSSNGTFVDQERLPPARPTPVAPGARLNVGPATFIVEYTPPATLETMPTTVLKSADVPYLKPAMETSVAASSPAPQTFPPAAPAEIAPQIAVGTTEATLQGTTVGDEPPSSDAASAGRDESNAGKSATPVTVPDFTADQTVTMAAPAQETVAAAFPAPPVAPPAPAFDFLGTAPPAASTHDPFDFVAPAEPGAAGGAATAPSAKVSKPKKSLFGFLKKKSPTSAPPKPDVVSPPAPPSVGENTFDFLGPSPASPAVPPPQPNPPADDPFAFLKGE